MEIRLEGSKLRGGYALVRTALPGGPPGGNWLLIKTKDGEARRGRGRAEGAAPLRPLRADAGGDGAAGAAGGPEA